MTGDCRPDPTRPRPDAAEQTADYLYRIARCEHRPQWQQPGGLCGGCGRDEFGVNTCVTCELAEDRWDPTDPLFTEGATQCPCCKRFDLEEVEQAA